MRRRWLVTVLILLLGAGTGVLLKRCPRTVPLEECSELYRHYAGTEGIAASFIQRYRLNDSVRIDVTLLQADDSAGWSLLAADFGIKELPPELQQLVDKHPSVTLKKLYDEQEGVPATYDVAAISRQQRSIAVLHFDSKKYSRDFVSFQVKEIHNANRKRK